MFIFYLLINEWGFILQASDIVNEDTELLVKLTTAYRHNARKQTNIAVFLGCNVL
jgi:hypothetical protein